MRRGMYLLPSALTVANILLGFFAVVQGIEGNFALATILVFVAGVVDFLDGRIARMTGTATEFGEEYDSLADVVTFGVAPAFLAYLWGLETMGRIGWLLPFFFLVCCATRLARFNVQNKVVDSRWFVGLPTPAAAGTICAIIFFFNRLFTHPDFDPAWRDLRPAALALLAVMLFVVGGLMVSTFRYRSAKAAGTRKRRSYRLMPFIAALVLVMLVDPHSFFLGFGLLYTASGPALWLWNRARRRGSGTESEEEDAPDEPATGGPAVDLPLGREREEAGAGVSRRPTASTRSRGVEETTVDVRPRRRSEVRPRNVAPSAGSEGDDAETNA